MTDDDIISSRLRSRLRMAQPTAADALAAANAAATTATTVSNRINAVETQLTNIAAQLQALITAAATAGGSAGGAGGGGGAAGGGGGGPRQAGPIPPALPSARRRIDSSGWDKLNGDVQLPQLRTWRNRWNDFRQLNQLSSYPPNEQTAAFRMALDPSMQQVVEVALNIPSTTPLTLDEILDLIADYIRSKRNIALDPEPEPWILNIGFR
jgi:hypothetical protein